MRNLITVTSKQTRQAAVAIIDAALYPSTNERTGRVLRALLRAGSWGGGAARGAVLRALDTDVMRDEHVAIAERICDEWEALAPGLYPTGPLPTRDELHER